MALWADEERPDGSVRLWPSVREADALRPFCSAILYPDETKASGGRLQAKRPSACLK